VCIWPLETLLYKYQPFWSLVHSFLTFNTQEPLIFSKTVKASFSFTSTMAEPSRRKIPTRRRTASRAPQPSTTPRTASIEGWISDEDKRYEFITLWKERPLITRNSSNLNGLSIDVSQFLLFLLNKGSNYSQRCKAHTTPIWYEPSTSTTNLEMEWVLQK